MKKWMEPLYPRTKEKIPASINNLDKMLGVILPIITYRIIDVGIVMIGATIIDLVASSNGNYAILFEQYSSVFTVLIKMIALILASCAVLPSFIKEKPIIFINKNYGSVNQSHENTIDINKTADISASKAAAYNTSASKTATSKAAAYNTSASKTATSKATAYNTSAYVKNPADVANDNQGQKSSVKSHILHTDRGIYIYWGILCGLLGASMSIFLNLAFNFFKLSSISQTFIEVAERQSSLGLGVGLLIYGLITPVAEEIVFRGILYNRLRRDYNLVLAFAFSSLIFGVFHGNLVQAIYGTIFGLLIVIVYERYGAFIYPIIIHAFANLVIYTVMQLPALSKYVMTIPGMIISGIIMVISLWLISKAPK